ncbi:MAG: M28 family peptidase [Bacteroidales bacterium]|nr:M28 family peptidase [Bacteroidales bacterium]
MRIIAIMVLAALVQITSAQTKITKPYVTPDDLKAWVSYLASDDMKGRLNGSVEMEEAAEWLAKKFKEFDLEPLEGFNSYIHNYTLKGRRESFPERNVLGFIEGRDPKLKDEYILITAHFDHIGIRKAVEGDSIYNGADDNAAGTSTLLGVAKAIKEGKMKPGRSIIFASVSGEEMGLHGSRELAKNPPFSLENVYVNVNFEMTGHSEEYGKGNYYTTGCSYTNLDDQIQKFNKGKNINLIDTIAIAERLFFASDNAAFARLKKEGDINIGIPGATFATTTMGSHIHKPSDEVELFDLDNMATLVNYFAEMVVWLSNSREFIDWTNPSFKRLED